MKKKFGFTLTETVLAMGVVGMLLTTFVMVFGPSKKSIQGSLAIQEADRLTLALTSELATLRPTEGIKYTTPFHKAFEWMRKTDQANRSILIYNYRGDLNKTTRPDGSLQPYKGGRDYVPGENTMVTTAVVLAEEHRARVEEDADSIIGPTFVVRMTQFVWDTTASKNTRTSSGNRGQTFGDVGGMYVLADLPGTINNPYDPKGASVSNQENYMYNPSDDNVTPWGAEVLYYAEFFQVPVMQKNAIKRLDYKNLKKPLFTRNLSFRR